MQRTLVLFVVWMIACFLNLAAAHGAPGAEVTTAAPKTDKPAPVPISVSHIPGETSEVETHIKNIQKELADQRGVSDVQKSLEASRKTVGSLQVRLQVMLYGVYSPRDLGYLRLQWDDLRVRLLAMDGQLDKQAKKLHTWLGEIEEQITVWKLTQTAVTNERAPQSMVTEVANTLQKLNSIEQNLETNRNRLVDLKDRILTQKRSVESALDRIEEARSNLVSQFFKPQDVFPWGEDWTSANRGWDMRAKGRNLKDLLIIMGDYLRRDYGRVILQFLIVVGLALAFRRIRSWRDRQGAPEANDGRTRQGGSHPDLMAYPWSFALLIGVSLTPVIHPTAPKEGGFFLGIFLVLAWLRVVRLLVPAERRGPLHGFAVLAFLVFARELFVEPPFLYGLYLMVELLLAGLGAFWLWRSQWLDGISSLQRGSFWHRFLKCWQALAMAAFSGGFLGVVLGYLHLGDAVATIFIEGTVIGAGWWAVVLIGEAIVSNASQRALFKFLHLDQRQRERFLSVMLRGMRALGFLAWSSYILVSVGLWSPLLDGVSRSLSTELACGSIVFSLGSVLAFGLTLWISWLLARLVSYFLYHGVFTRLPMPPGVPFALSSFFRYTILVFGFLMAIANLGLAVDRIVLMISALGVGIGFGLQNIAKDIVSGAVLLFERPVRLGDWVEMNTLFGVVTRIGLRSTTIRTREGADVVVPNGDLVSGHVTNWTLSDQKHRIQVELGVAYGTDPEKVLQILTDAAQSHPDVLVTPASQPLFRGFGESSLDFQIRCWTQSTKRGWQAAIKSDLTLAISKALAENGIEIPFPQRDLHVRSVTPELPGVLPQTPRTVRGSGAQSDQDGPESGPKEPE